MGLRRLSIQPVPAHDDQLLPVGQTALHHVPHLLTGVPGVQVLQHGVLHPDDVHQGQGAPLVLLVQGVVQGHLPRQPSGLAQVHEHLVLNAPGGVGGQLDLLLHVVGVDRFDETQGADGDEVVGVAADLGVVFFDDVGDQAQVVFDELPPRRLVAGGGQFQAAPFLLGGERFGKGALGAQPQGGEVALEQEQDEHGKHIGFPLCGNYIPGGNCPMTPTKSKILREPFRFHILGSNELTLRRDFVFSCNVRSNKKESHFQALFSKIQSFTIWCFSDFPLKAKAIFTA